MARAGLLPTPGARDYKDCGAPSEARQNTQRIASIAGGRLNPRFVEAMMLYPDNWTHPSEPSGERQALDEVEPTTTERGVAPRIRMLGNAIVPDIAAEIGRAILETEKQANK